MMVQHSDGEIKIIIIKLTLPVVCCVVTQGWMQGRIRDTSIDHGGGRGGQVPQNL